MFFEFDDAKLLAVEEQFMVGPSLLITPVLREGKAAVTGYFPSSDGTTWRDWTTGEVESCPLPQRPMLIFRSSIPTARARRNYLLLSDRSMYTSDLDRSSSFTINLPIRSPRPEKALTHWSSTSIQRERQRAKLSSMTVSVLMVRSTQS
jgi:hypothetical protein